MQTALDIIGSLFLFGIFILSMNNLNVVVMDTMAEANISAISQGDRNSLAEVLDHDFLKMGYRKGGVKIDTLSCSAKSVAWYSDVDRNGTMDTVRYYLNENDSTRLERQVNGSTITVRRGVTRFSVSYQDSTGALIPASSLPTVALNVRGVGIHVEFSNVDQKVEGKKNEAFIDRKYFPRSLKP